MAEQTFMQRYLDLAAAGEPFVAVTLVDAHGSTPQDIGSKMLVTTEGLVHGTVGGGRVEARAIDEARRLLTGNQSTAFFDWNLRNDIGMTCGGSVRMFFETVNLAEWQIVVFGAGHVAQALAKLLVDLPCSATFVDSRGDWLDRLPPAVRRVTTDNAAGLVDQLTDDSFVLCMTQGHATDLPVLKHIFSTHREFPYLGVIGSKSKAAVLRKELRAAEIPDEQIVMHCPVGLPLGSNHPAEIAISIAAQLLQVRDLIQSEAKD